MLAARVEPKNAPQESKKTDNFKLLVFRQFQAGDDTGLGTALSPPLCAASSDHRSVGCVASRSRLIQKILGHEHVAHRDAPIEVAEEGGLGVLGQLVALHCLFSIMISPV